MPTPDEQAFETPALDQPGLDPVAEELPGPQTPVRSPSPRIQSLERALDQAMDAIHDLQRQIQGQQFLENQLAATEEYAQVQRQVISDLQLQIQAQTYPEVPAQGLADHQILQGVLSEAEAFTTRQQQQVRHLRAQLKHDRAEAQMYQSQLERQLGNLERAIDQRQKRIEDLESQSLAARSQSIALEVQSQEAQHHVTQLQETLQKRRAAIAKLQGQLEETREALHAQQILTAKQSATIADLDQALRTAHSKTEALETQIDRQTRSQARFQQRDQELDQELSANKDRLQRLEQQIVEMQEQILHQAQQSREYETAVQHWRQRHTQAQTQLDSLQHLLRLQQQAAERGEGDRLPPSLQQWLQRLEAGDEDSGSGSSELGSGELSSRELSSRELGSREAARPRPKTTPSGVVNGDLHNIDLPNFGARHPS